MFYRYKMDTTVNRPSCFEPADLIAALSIMTGSAPVLLSDFSCRDFLAGSTSSSVLPVSRCSIRCRAKAVPVP